MALDIGDWLATPAPLNTEKHGDRARFSGDNCVVERWEPEQDPGNCVCYTSRPLPPGQVWQTTILNTTTRRWRYGLVSGCIRAQFLVKLKASLGGSYARFETMSSLDKSSFVLGNELWEEHFESLLALVKAYIIDIWEERKSKLYGDVECA